MFRLAVFISTFCLAQLMCHAQTTQDSVVVQASLMYEQPNLFKRIFHGKNYRKEWSTPVKMPVFNIKRERGGFVIAELGGGEQTKSLKLYDKKGREWALRSVDKTVEKALPTKLQNTYVEKIVQDFISAGYPYGALTVHTLTSALNVPAPNPRLFYVPDDPAFGQYRELFANTVCFLEEREPTPDGSATLSMEEFRAQIVNDNERRVMQKAVLKARLIDMLIADWDRHDDQWRWGQRDSAGVKLYYVIPRDRDQAYFHSNGLFMKAATFFVPHMRGFKPDGRKIKKLNTKAWEFDADFLNGLDRKDWETTIAEFQHRISDALIDSSIMNLPPEIRAISGDKIASTLRSRRDNMMKQVMRYYDFLAATVEINGSKESELFVVEGVDRNLKVTVYNYTHRDTTQRLYTRLFDPKETKHISLTGLDGNDRFEFKGDKPVIRVTMDGGKGKDEYDVASMKRIKVEDHE